MRPTGGRAIMTLRSSWVKVIAGLVVGLVVTLVLVSMSLVTASRTVSEQKETIAMQASEIKELNISMARKDEKIISLKKKVSTSSRHQAPVTKSTAAELPKIHAPIVEVTEAALEGDRISFKIQNVHPGDTVARGYFFAVYKEGNIFLSYPAVTLVSGLPVDKKSGMAFSIRNFKPMTIKTPRSMQAWSMVTFYVFDTEGNLRLVMPLNREQMQ